MLQKVRALVDHVDPPSRLRQLRAQLRAAKPRTVYFLATRQHLYTIQWHLEGWGRALADLVVALPYDELFARIAPSDWWDALHESAWGDEALLRRLELEPPPGVYIFADLERLSLDATRKAAIAWNALARYGGPSVKLLNHPTRTMRRYELLRTLYERGINPFNVYHLTEARWPTKYPVFVRYASNHASPRPELLRSRPELERMIARVDRRGIDRNDVLIEEYVETGDAQGRYRSYSAFVVGNRIFPSDARYSKDWVVKQHEILDEAAIRDDEEFVIDRRSFPEDQLRAIFRMARIEYGRADFMIHNGRLLVWEINTNPTILPHPVGSDGRPQRIRVCVRERIDSAMRALVSP